MKILKFIFIFLFVFILFGCDEEEVVDNKIIKFYDGDNVLVSEIEIPVDEIESIIYPSHIEKEGYTFSGWTSVADGDNISYYMNYSKNSYKVSYYYDGMLIHYEDVLYQESGTFVPADIEGYNYSFDKDVSCIENDLDVNVTYEKQMFEVIFKLGDEVLETKTVEYGSDLSDYLNEVNGYEFNGWDKDLTNIKSDLVVTGNYKLIDYNIEYELNNYEFENIKWENKTVFVNEFYNDFFDYLKDNYFNLGITKNGNLYTFKKNSVTITFSSVQDIKLINVYDFEKTLGHLIYAPCERPTDEAIIPSLNEKYFLNSSKYLEKYKDLDRYFLSAIVNNYTSYSKTYNESSGRIQIFFRFQQWQQGTNIPVFDSLPYKCEVSKSFNVTNSNPLAYNAKNPIAVEDPISEYKFLGWYDNEYFTGKSITNISIDTLGTLRDLKLYAMWDFDTEVHEVTFMGAKSTVLAKYYIESGETIVPPEPNELLGFTFYKWDKDYSNITSDIVIKALYDPIEYSITYDPQFSDVEFDGLEKYTIVDNYELPVLSKKGYLFLGWYTKDGVRVEKTTYGDLNVKAKWVNYDIENGVIGNGTINLVKSDEVYVNRSINVYVKRMNEYISPANVTFSVVDKDGKISIDENGFVKGIKSGSSMIIATYNNDVCALEIVVHEDSQMQYIGHTGCRGAGIVQNTASAFLEGAKRGYYALECDVRVSSEGVYYIHHDDVFMLSGTVMPFTLDSLNKYGLSENGLQAACRWDTVLSNLVVHKNGDTLTTSKLISVEDYLKICKENNTKALLELKWTTGINSNDQSKLGGLVELVKKYGMYENAIFMTSMKNCLTYLRNNYPDATLQFLSGASTTTDSNINWCIENRISLDAASGNVTADIVKKMHNAFLYVNSYTVNSQGTANSLINLGVDYITTDDLK